LGVSIGVPKSWKSGYPNNEVNYALLTNGIDPSCHRQKEKMAKLAKEARRLAATRFTLENGGGLSIRLGRGINLIKSLTFP
jgi:hypothetical protein